MTDREARVLVEELLHDHFSVVVDAVAEELESIGNDMGSCFSDPKGANAADDAAVAIRRMIRIARESE